MVKKRRKCGKWRFGGGCRSSILMKEDWDGATATGHPGHEAMASFIIVNGC